MTASPQASLKGRSLSGVFSVMRTVSGSMASTEVMPSNRAFCALVLSAARARSSEKITSCASKALPS